MRLSKKWLWIYLYLENFDIPGIILQRRYPEINGQNIWKKFVTKITFNSNVAIKKCSRSQSDLFGFWRTVFLLDILIQIIYCEGFFGRVSCLHPYTIFHNNHLHNILRLVAVLPNFPLTSSETKRDY